MITINYVFPILAAILGGLAGIYLHGKITKDVKILLAFSGAYLFALTVLHLLPELFELGQAGYFILIGFLLQLVLDYFSKGVEHGHVHPSDVSSAQFPLGIFISLFLHSFIEGLPLVSGELGHHGHSHGDHGLLIGISLHKVPEAIALAALLFYTFKAKGKVLSYLLIYATATPMGMWAGTALMGTTWFDPATMYSHLLAIAVGIFIHVSTTIIFEADEHHRISFKKICAILVGLALVALV